MTPHPSSALRGIGGCHLPLKGKALANPNQRASRRSRDRVLDKSAEKVTAENCRDPGTSSTASGPPSPYAGKALTCVPPEAGQELGPQRGRRQRRAIRESPLRRTFPCSTCGEAKKRSGKRKRSGFCRSFFVYSLIPYRQTSSPFSTSTVMVAPGARSPRRMVRATRVSTLLCSTRRRGRAP